MIVGKITQSRGQSYFVLTQTPSEAVPDMSGVESHGDSAPKKRRAASNPSAQKRWGSNLASNGRIYGDNIWIVMGYIYI